MKLRYFAAVCCVLAGCGGGLDDSHSSKKLEIQGMRQDAAPRTVQGISAASPTGTSVAEDIVKIPDFRANYAIKKDEKSGIVTISSLVDTKVQTFLNPSTIQFVDYYTSFDISGAPGQVFRIYQAAFNRKPDLSGLGFWIYQAQNGIGLSDIAAGFLGSDEFAKAYGVKPLDSVYVNQLYLNVLHRPGEAAGVKWWNDVLTAGVDRKEVIIGFSESDENKNNVNPSLANGFDFVPFVPAIRQPFSNCGFVEDTVLVTKSQYTILNNVYNKNDAINPLSCMNGVINVNDGVSGTFDWAFESTVYSSKAYPEIAFGWKPQAMTASNTTKLPRNVTNLENMVVTGKVETTCSSECQYDNAFDLWFQHGAKADKYAPLSETTEMMIWTSTNRDTSYEEGYVGTVTVDGESYKLYHKTIVLPANVCPNCSWNYIQFVAVKNTNYLNLNIKSFVVAAYNRGFLSSSDYLESIEYGTEIIKGAGKTRLLNYKIQ